MSKTNKAWQTSLSFINTCPHIQGGLFLNTFLRASSAILTIALIMGIAPLISLLFGQEDKSQGAVIHGASASEHFLTYLKAMMNDSILHHGKLETLTYLTIILFLLYFFKNVFAYAGLYFFTPIKNGAVAQIRNDLYAKTLRLPLAFFAKNKKGDLISRMSGDVQEIDQNILGKIQQALVDALMAIALFF